MENQVFTEQDLQLARESAQGIQTAKDSGSIIDLTIIGEKYNPTGKNAQGEITYKRASEKMPFVGIKEGGEVRLKGKLTLGTNNGTTMYFHGLSFLNKAGVIATITTGKNGEVEEDDNGNVIIETNAKNFIGSKCEVYWTPERQEYTDEKGIQINKIRPRPIDLLITDDLVKAKRLGITMSIAS